MTNTRLFPKEILEILGQANLAGVEERKRQREREEAVRRAELKASLVVRGYGSW